MWAPMSVIGGQAIPLTAATAPYAENGGILQAIHQYILSLLLSPLGIAVRFVLILTQQIATVLETKVFLVSQVPQLS